MEIKTNDLIEAGMRKRLMSADEAAFYLGVKKSTVYSWAWRGKIPSVKMGRRLLFDLVDLNALIAEGKRPASDYFG